jgi:hypothetical protein
MSIFFIIQHLLTTDSLTAKTIGKSIIVGLISGGVAGFLFGLIIGWFKSSKFIDTTTKIETQPDENILFLTPANHYKGAEGVGGRLYLTNKRLVFKSHKLNIQNHELSINLTNIDKIERYKNVGFINNGLSVTLTNSKVEKFVVEQAEEWFKKLG